MPSGNLEARQESAPVSPVFAEAEIAMPMPMRQTCNHFVPLDMTCERCEQAERESRQNGEFDEFCEAEARQEQWDSDIREFEEFQNLARSNNQ